MAASNRALCALLLLLLIQQASAAEVKLTGTIDKEAYSPGEELKISVKIENSANRTVNLSLKHDVKMLDAGWNTVDIVEGCPSSLSIAPLEIGEYGCKYLIPETLKTGHYKLFARADVVGGTFSYTNLFFNVGRVTYDQEIKVKGDAIKSGDDTETLLLGVTILMLLILGVVVFKPNKTKT